MLTRVLPRSSSSCGARVRVTVTSSTSGAKRRVARALPRLPEYQWHFDLDLPARQDRQLDGRRRLGDAAVGGLGVLDAYLELALDDGTARAQRVEEGDVLDAVLRPRRAHDEDDGQGEQHQGEPLHRDSPACECGVAGWRRAHPRPRLAGSVTSSG